MPLFITNDTVSEHFTLEEYLPVAEEMYAELGRGRASSTPRQTTVSHAQEPRDEAVEPAFHVMRTMGGSIKGFGVAAMRLNSDVKHWPERHGRKVQERVPVADGRYNGWVLLFDTDTGELLAVFPDGLIQTFHVAGGIAMGAKYLAPDDTTSLGVYGTGHQATSHVPALDHVLDLETIEIYSPTRAHRDQFAAEMDDRLDPEVRAVESPREVCAGADVVTCATNSTEPVFEAEWLEPGTHVGFIRPNEIPEALWTSGDVDVFAVSTVDQPVYESSLGSGYISERDGAADPWRWFLRPDDPPYPKTAPRSREPSPIDEMDVTRLPDLVVDESLGRGSAEDITLFAQRGDGVAFAGIGHALYQLATEEGLGEEVDAREVTQEHVP